MVIRTLDFAAFSFLLRFIYENPLIRACATNYEIFDQSLCINRDKSEFLLPKFC